MNQLSKHRANAVQGLHLLAEFLEREHGNAYLNEASRVEVQYCVLESDRESARADFNEAREHLKSFDQYYFGAQFAERDRHDEEHNSIQHVAELSFAENTVVYSVLWIERLEDEA